MTAPSGTVPTSIESDEHDPTFTVKKVMGYEYDGQNAQAPTSKLVAKQIYESGAITYVCKAPIGSALTSTVWQIKKVDDTTGATTWCDGDANFDNVATDLATVAALTYS